MFRKPRLKPHLRADVAAPDLVVVRSEDGHEVFPGRLLPLIVPFLDGAHGEAEIAAALAGRASILDVRFGLSLLTDAGCLAEGDGAEAPAPDRAVEVVALGSISPDPLVAVLAASGVRAGTGGPRVVLADDYLDPRLEGENRAALAAGRPWLLVRPVGAMAWIGPWFYPPETACWACLAARLELNFPYRRLLAREDGAPGPEVPLPASPVASGLALHVAVRQILRFLDASPPPAEILTTFDPGTLELAEHRFVRRPSCPLCGTPAPPPERLPEPLEIRAVPRTESAEGILARLAHHVSPVTGLVASLRDHGDSQFPGSHDRPGGAIHVYVADHAFPAFDRREALRGGLRRKSAGKGVSAAQAQAGALCEALERCSGVFQGHEPRRAARFVDLGDDAVDPRLVLGYSAAQYRERERWNALGQPYAWVPEPFDPERTVDWSPLWSLTEDRFKYLPTACCYFGAPMADGHRFCRPDSNGCAAGATREEAILHGFLELVERDAVALWWHHRRRAPQVDLPSFARPDLDVLVAACERLGRTVWALDVTADFPIPTFVAVSFAGQGQSDLLLGFGAHFDAEIALTRALTELGQFLPGWVHGREREVVSGPIADPSFLLPYSSRGRAEYPRPPRRAPRAEILHCAALARRRGLETLVLDQTRPEIGLAVVRVVVPGLCTFWPRFGPKRLYDVPVAMGWHERPAREDELNPVYLLI